MSTSRPDIELVLDIRSYEHVIVLANHDEPKHPAHWIKISSRDELSCLNSDSVVVVDRVDVSFAVLRQIGEARPRLVAFVPCSIEHEKSIRRLISSMSPWAEVWTLSSSLGKLIVTGGILGPAYDRQDVIDQRSIAQA